MQIKNWKSSIGCIQFGPGYFVLLFVLAVVLAKLTSFLPSQWVGGYEPTLWVFNFSLAVLFAFVTLLFLIFKKKVEGNEGFFFMGTLVFKLLVVSVLLPLYISLTEKLNHSVVFLFVVSYFIYSGVYLYYFLKVIKKQPK